jgi:diaminopimelate decarboxylase
VQPWFELRDRGGVRSLWATRAFGPGDTVETLRPGSAAAHASPHTLQTSETTHILLEPAYLRAVNHSCEPNVFFDVDGARLECLRSIAAGEEIVSFYPATEWSMAEPFDCVCGTPSCLGVIRGAAATPPEVLRRHRLAEHVRGRFCQVKEWWARPDLRYEAGSLMLGATNLARLATSAGGPAYVCSVKRVREKLASLRAALSSRQLDHRIFYAMKANRHPGLLARLAEDEALGVDCCSPAEILLARQSGFEEERITFTGTGVSSADIEVLARHPGVQLNCDSISQIKSLGRACPGRAIGLRVNTGLGVSYKNTERLAYAGARTTKVGIYEEQLDVALEVARSVGLAVVGVHCHSGWGIADDALDAYSAVFDRLRAFVERIPGLCYLNLGGGLGVPLQREDARLDLARFTATVARAFESLRIPLYFEPGDYLVKDAGLLLLQVTSIEQKRDRVFVFVNGGHNLNVEAAHYGLRHEVVPLVLRPGAPLSHVTIAGNINETIDVFAEDVELPEVFEGDFVGLLHAGGYGASMSSNHCMRGACAEYLV